MKIHTGFLLILFLLLAQSSSAGSSYTLTEAITYSSDNIELQINELSVDFTEFYDETQSYSYYQFSINFGYQVSVTDGALFVLLDLPYEDDSGFNINSKNHQKLEVVKNKTSDPLERTAISPSDTNTYDELSNFEFLLGEYYKVGGQYNETTKIQFVTTFSTKLDVLNADLHVIYSTLTGTQTNTTLHVVSDSPISYTIVSTQNKNGFVPAPYPAIFSLVAIPVILLVLKKQKL